MKGKVKRQISEYSKVSEELMAEIELIEFDLDDFQREFEVRVSSNPMYDSFLIAEAQTAFVEKYISLAIKWNFETSYYYLEAHAI